MSFNDEKVVNTPSEIINVAEETALNLVKKATSLFQKIVENVRRL